MKGVDFFGGFSSGNALSRLSESEREISLGALGIFLTKERRGTTAVLDHTQRRSQTLLGLDRLRLEGEGETVRAGELSIVV